MPQRGKYIVIEGNDGTGKSTQVKLLREYLASKGIESVEYQEPAGTPISSAIRQVIVNGELQRDSMTNLLLFTAARHEIWLDASKKLDQGKWVVCSRNYYSSLAYQGYGEGLDPELIKKTTETFTDGTYMRPDMSVILSLDHQTRSSRIHERGKTQSKDTFESRANDFQDRVNQGYQQIAADYGIPLIDAAEPPDEVALEILKHIEPLI